MILSNQSSPTPLEPCRIAPYVNVPALRNSSQSTNASVTTGANPSLGFAPFDPALITAAHQVILAYFLSFQ